MLRSLLFGCSQLERDTWFLASYCKEGKKEGVLLGFVVGRDWMMLEVEVEI
jgi:hypothetical protein